MEHPLRVAELPHADTPPDINAEPPPAPLATSLPPLPDLPASDATFLKPSDRHYKDYLPAASTCAQLSPALRAVCKTVLP